MKLTSIIINNYNYGRYLGKSIESALKQTYPNTEVIVVDDGSTDNSREIIAQYIDWVIPIFKENGGQGSAYNIGFNASRGDVICFLDSDDMLLPTAIEKAVSLFDNEDIVKVQWPLYVIDRTDKETGELMPKQTPIDENLREFVIQNGPFYDSNFTPPGSAWSRKFLEKVFPVPELPYKLGADEYLITLAPIFGQIRTLKDPHGCYRLHGSNNYFSRELDDSRIEDYIARFEVNSQVLNKYLNTQGITIDQEVWKQRNFNYIWLNRLRKARKYITSVIPEGDSYILVNDNEWGYQEPIAGRKALYLYGQDGQNPMNDEEAICKINNLRFSGANYILFWWTSYWWLEHYPEMYSYLDKNFTPILESDYLKVFDLQRKRTK